ncbi:MAG: DNA replication/repair protein RecF [Bacteroidia bacterium]
MHYFSQLRLTFFRNYEGLNVAFSPAVNCFSGKNGAGKTNILDALHFLALTKGFRSSQDKQAIKESEQFFFIEGHLQTEEKQQQIQCNYLQGKTKKLLINGTPLAKMSEHLGNIPLVAILPNDTALINEGASERRKFLDSLISQYSRPYLESLIQYEKVLAQRNALLKLFGEKKFYDKEQLSLWDMQLIPLGQKLWAERQDFLQRFQPYFLHFFQRIVSEKEKPQLLYVSKIQENSTDEWEKLFQEHEWKDRINQTTSIGIHKDDIEFTINEVSVKGFGSQGQQKTFVIALKLAQYELLRAHKTVNPILLLDDVFDKLDEFRLQQIADLLDKEMEGQVFITDTSHQRLFQIFENSARKVAFFEVDAGNVSRYK